MADAKTRPVAAERMRQWSLNPLAENQAIREPALGVQERARRTRYPARLLRYWFGYHALRDEATRLGRPLNVLEVGVGNGKFRAFFSGAAPYAQRELIGVWAGLSRKVDHHGLSERGYDRLIECDASNLNELRLACQSEEPFDAIVLLHFLEHLHDPEATLRVLVPGLRPGGVVVGGFPCTPEFARVWWERRLRRNPAPFGHVSAFSPQRVRRMAAAAQLDCEWLTGAFFVRASGSPFEEREWWARFNLAWGRRFPGWPGECYWLMKKRAPGS